MYRSIWMYYFITGLLSLTAGVPAMDSWADSLLPAEGASCHVATALAGLSRADLSLCLAAGIAEARAAAGTGLSLLADIHRDMALADWIRVADVAVIAAGLLAAALAIVCVWANAMTRLAGLSLTGTYTLVRAVGIALERR
jgi:hypothetical protein